MTEFLSEAMEELKNIFPFNSYHARTLIDYVARKGTISMSELSKVDTSDKHKLTDKLEELEDKGYVTLKSKGKEIESISITEKGLNVYKQSKEIEPKVSALTKILES
jgi:predicted transcriptional regulator